MTYSHLLRRLSVASAVLFSCVLFLHNTAAGSPPRYRLSVSDRPDQRRFVIALHSMDKRPLCLYQFRWPNKNGEIGSDWVILESSEGKFKARDVNFGLMPPEN